MAGMKDFAGQDKSGVGPDVARGPPVDASQDNKAVEMMDDKTMRLVWES